MCRMRMESSLVGVGAASMVDSRVDVVCTGFWHHLQALVRLERLKLNPSTWVLFLQLLYLAAPHCVSAVPLCSPVCILRTEVVQLYTTDCKLNCKAVPCLVAVLEQMGWGAVYSRLNRPLELSATETCILTTFA